MEEKNTAKPQAKKTDGAAKSKAKASPEGSNEKVVMAADKKTASASEVNLEAKGSKVDAPKETAKKEVAPNVTETKASEPKKTKEVKNILGKLKRHFGKTLQNATKEEIYKASASCIRDDIVDMWVSSREEKQRDKLKQVYYLSAEFLMGRAYINNMINLGMEGKYKAAFEYLGVDINEIANQENDAGLGNGGLGRLAACFLDSLATLELPAMGCGIRYEYGLFKQKIVNGEQVEIEDNWLQDGFVWEIERPEDSVEVHFGGEVEETWTSTGMRPVHQNFSTVMAVPFDMPIVGYKSKHPATLRLWSARAQDRFDLNFFDRGDYVKAMEERELAEVISKVLYPNDNHERGKELRLKQFYFFTSATVQNIVREHKKKHGSLRTLPQFAVIQINDTHPTLAIPELMRILLDEEGFTWQDAFSIVQSMFNYTNHTILAEALECWDEQMFKILLPRIYGIIKEINERYCKWLNKFYLNDFERISRMSVIAYGQIRMANLCVAICAHINGVSQLHGDILKKSLFADEYRVRPGKFMAITNGMTPRRWLAVANPKLTSLITETIGDGFLKNYDQLKKLEEHADNPEFVEKFRAVKYANKLRLARYLEEEQGVIINPNAMFDVQAKRLHEYKRQLLKCLHILYLYNKLNEDPSFMTQPVVFLFAAKAAPGYARAKSVIRLIAAIGDMVKENPVTRDMIQVVFIEDYRVSNAEILIPAADLSEQISMAGMEASGTGNMKFMLNGSLTIGTLDGANVEMTQQLGKENIFLFGATVEEIDNMKRFHSHRPGEIYEQNIDIRNAIGRLIDGTLPDVSSRRFSDLYQSLLFGEYGTPDQYFILHDFMSYVQAWDKARHIYQRTPDEYTKMAIRNTARAGFFSSDRTISEYNDMIWHLKAFNE